MNRQQRRIAMRLCRLEGHLSKTDGTGRTVPVCVRCGEPTFIPVRTDQKPETD